MALGTTALMWPFCRGKQKSHKVRVQKSVVNGQWSVVSGQWSVVSGQKSVVSGQWSEVRGQRSEVKVRGQRLRSEPSAIAV